MSIIYEVNLKVAQPIAEAYLSWLRDHIDEMLQTPGFLEAKLYEEQVASNDRHWVVQYFVSSEEALQHYLTVLAPGMRQKALSLFGDKFQATRRILMNLER